MEGLNVLVLIFILAFAIDRLTEAILFLLSYTKIWRQRLRLPDPNAPQDASGDPREMRRAVLLRVGIQFLLSFILVCAWKEVSLLQALKLSVGREGVSGVIEVLVTTIVLTGGSDFVGKILGISGIKDLASASASPPPPIEVKGRIILEKDVAP